MQFSNAELPHHNDSLYWFLHNPDRSSMPIETVVDAFIGTAMALAPAVRTVIESHVVTDEPVIVEGDGILPALCRDPNLLPLGESGLIRWCCIKPGSPDQLLGNMMRRGRGVDDSGSVELRSHVEAVSAYGHWLAEQSDALDIPTVPANPEGSAVERVLMAMGVGDSPGSMATLVDR